jgi:hypothetical protein
MPRDATKGLRQAPTATNVVVVGLSLPSPEAVICEYDETRAYLAFARPARTLRAAYSATENNKRSKRQR